MPDLFTVVSALSLVFAAIPALLYARNLSVFHPAPSADEAPEGAVSVLIPARDEAANIEACLDAALAASGRLDVEALVLDDHSTDGTAEIVAAYAARDARVRLLSGAPLPEGWNGKQHACWQLAQAARRDALLLLDADVRLEAGALPRLLAERQRSGADLVSGFPRQVTETALERLLLPLIHFVLLGFLSLRGMRRSLSPSLAAGCGQLFLTTRAAYEAAGGHAAVRASRHDGITLPRAYRRAGLSTDVFDATDLARCRMYDGAGATWRGLAKNATEGVATPALILPVSAMLLLGQVAPLPLLALADGRYGGDAGLLAVAASACSYLPRLDAVWRFRQSPLGALLHPLGVLLFVAIQWEALGRELLGRPVAWRGR